MTKTLGQAKISTGGQITLNKKIRDELGVDIGNYVMFQKDGTKLVLLPAELKPRNSG